jgi:hypothetical protein
MSSVSCPPLHLSVRQQLVALGSSARCSTGRWPIRRHPAPDVGVFFHPASAERLEEVLDLGRFESCGGGVDHVCPITIMHDA